MNHPPSPTKILPKRRPVWERSKTPPAYRLQPRDIEIVREIFRHRVLQPAHLRALFGGSKVNLTRRCRHLYHDHYLERPLSQRPLRILTEELVYGAAPKGLQLLEQHYPDLRAAGRDWGETPRRQRTFGFLDHELGIATVLVTIRVACERAGVRFGWDGYHKNHRYRFLPPGAENPQKPDALFYLEIPGRGFVAHFLELDRATKKLETMRDRYNGYFRWWKFLQTAKEPTTRVPKAAWKPPFRTFRVVTVTTDKNHMNALQRAAKLVGRDRTHKKTWRGLLFSHLDYFDLELPDQALKEIFHYAEEEKLETLLGPFQGRNPNH